MVLGFYEYDQSFNFSTYLQYLCMTIGDVVTAFNVGI